MTPPDPSASKGADHDRPFSSLPETLTLKYCPGGDDPVATAMEGWLEALAQEAAGRLVFERAEAQEQPFLPSLSLETESASRVHYHFVPEGPELPVFREFIWNASSRVASESTDTGSADASAPRHEMLLFVSAHCPNCPHAVRTVHRLAGMLPNLSVHLFEAMLHTGLAEKHAIQSVPTLLIDGELRYVGGLEEQKLYSLLSAGDPESFQQEKIRKQIKEGGSALEAAEWIAGGGDPSFLAEDLGESTFEERIALLCAMEEALETDPRCLDRMVAPLLTYLESEHPSVRGDIADLLGKIGDPQALPAVKKLLEDPDPNVVEAAQEAVETLEEGS
jgi:hypothetical protein